MGRCVSRREISKVHVSAGLPSARRIPKQQDGNMRSCGMKDKGLFALALVLVVSIYDCGCVRSKCYSNADCPEGQVCDLESGKCFVPECTSDTDCP